MMKTYRKYTVIFIITIILVSFAVSAKAFSIAGFNPISFLQNTGNILATRVSDFVHYLVMQKKYIFDNYTDPNSYPPMKVPTAIEDLTSSLAIPTSTGVTSLNVPRATTSTSILPSQNNSNFSITNLFSQLVGVSSSSLIRQSVDYSNDSKILIYTNIERQKVSLAPLISDPVLDKIAGLRVDDLFSNQYFEHISPDGRSATDLAKALGFEYLLIGENLALGHFDGDKDIVDSWMDSPGHKENILNGDYKRLGVAIKTGLYKGENVTIAVQIFAEPLDDCSRPNQNTKNLIDNLTITISEMQTKALVLYDNLNLIKDNPQVDRSYYYQKVQEYNYYAKQVNDAVLILKGIIDSYNVEVGKYNSCINN